MRISLKVALFILISLFSAGLSQAKPPDSSREIQSVIQEKGGFLQIGEAVSFKKPLELKQVLWLAFTRNPEFKARLAQAQVSVADMRLSGLPESPEAEFGARFPVSSPGSKTAYDLQVTQNLLDLLQLPSRKKMARSEYDKRKWEITSEILGILTEVKQAYYRYQAALQLKSFWQSNLTAAQAAAELAAEQRKAGNISALDESLNLSLLKTAQLELSQSLYEVKQSRVLLAKLMGFPLADLSWKIRLALPNLPARDPGLEKLKGWAEQNRPEFIAQKNKIEADKRSLTLAKTAVLPRLNAGVGVEWSAEGSKGVGPVVQVGFPFLGHRRANIQKARAELNASRLALSAMEQSMPYDLEGLYQQLTLSRQAVHFYQSEVLPVQARILDESLKHYNYMLLGNYELLESKRNQINAKRDSIHALRDYWMTRSALEGMVGGDLGRFE